MRVKIKSKILLLLFVLTDLIQAQVSASYNYNLFLNLVKETNPLSQRAENNVLYGKALMKAAQGNFDPLLSSNVESKQFNSTNYFTFGHAELKQPIYTSHYLKAGYQYGQGMYLNPERTTSAVGLPYIGLEASLLQGLTFDKRRADLLKSRYYSEYFTAEQQIQMNELLFAASNVYVDALFAKRINTLYDYFASLADQRLKGVSDLSVIGERAAIDTIEAAIFLQGRLLDKQAGEIEMIKRLNELEVLNPGSVTFSDISLTDSLEQLFVQAFKSMQRIMTSEQSPNPVISLYYAKQKLLETERRLKRELIKPVFNVNYNFLNASKDVIAPSFNSNNYKWGATFSFPVFLRKPRSEFKMADIEVKNNELELTNKLNQLNFKGKYILEAIQITANQIRNAERSASYSKLLVEAERLKFTNGESSLFLLNSRESKWLETELKLAEYKLKFIKSFIEYTYVVGTLKYEL